MSIASATRSQRSVLIDAPPAGVEHLGEHLLDDPPPPVAPADIVPPLEYPPPARSLDGEGDGASSIRAEWESDSSSHRGRRRPRVDAIAPLMAVRQMPLVGTLLADLIRETAGRDRFAAFGREDLRAAALTLARYRLSTLAIIRQTDKDARRMFLSDLRDLERQAFPEMQLLMQLLAHFAHAHKPRVNPKDPLLRKRFCP